MSNQSLPIIDIAPLASSDRRQWQPVIEAIHQACCDIGFFYITGHGIPQAQFDAMQQMALRFFSQPEAEKARIAITQSANHRGWGALSAEQLDPGAPADRKETFDMALDLPPTHPQVARCPQLYGPNQYPELSGFEALLTKHYTVTMQVAMKVLTAMALALGQNDDFFTRHFRFPVSVLRLLHYPPVQPGSTLGAGAHTDYGCITLLYQDELGGLQVKNIDEQWLNAPPVAGSLVVNIGDLMQRWTGHLYKSTPHRVISPQPGLSRFSMPFFVEPDFDTLVEPVLSTASAEPEPAVTAGDWILSRFADTYAYRAAR